LGTFENFNKSIVFDNPDANTTNINVDNGSSYKVKYKIGYSVYIEPRVYYASEGLEGGYFGLQLNACRYNFNETLETNTSDNNGVITNNDVADYKGFQNQNTFYVKWGSQAVFDKITLDWACGLGMTSYTAKQFTTFGNYNDSKITRMTGKGSRFATMIHLTLGYHF
jgi:hypothetical protein